MQQQVFNKTLTIEEIEKVLKAKKQERLTLTNKINRLEEEKNTLELLLEGKNNQYNAATQECEKLKKQYNCNACGSCNGKEDYKNMQRHCEKVIAQNHKYKQALDEIEELCKNHPFCDCSCGQDILYIINKVKDGE